MRQLLLATCDHKMKSILPFLLILAFVTVQADNNPREREQKIAKRDVWHAAKLRGVSFRAIGQEPGWLLEISNGEKIYLVTDYGRNKTSYRYVEPEVNRDQRRTVFSIKDKNLEVLIEGKDCTDIMSGEKFAVSVIIAVDKKQLKGCGRALY